MRKRLHIEHPKGLVVDHRSPVPLHLQLQARLRHLIGTRALTPRTRLPAVRDLARTLGINRNTVARALSALRGEGFLDSHQGRGTFVADRAPVSEGRAGRIAALLVECNREELARYRDELETDLPLRVEGVLLEDLARRLATEPGLLAGFRLVLTTFFHVREVERALPADGPPTVALLSHVRAATLRRLSDLPEETAVGIVCATPGGTQSLLRSLQAAGVVHLLPILAATDDPWSVERMLERTRIVVCSEQAAAGLGARLPEGVELILADRVLETGELRMLRGLLEAATGSPGDPDPVPAARGEGARAVPRESARAAGFLAW